MSPLYLFNNKLLVKDSKLATSVDCCCLVCKSCTPCGCNHGTIVGYQQLWDDIQDYIDLMELVCDPITGTMYGPESPIPIPPSAIPINCGQWKPINERTSLCNEICYNIYEYIAGLCGWTLNDLQTISPSKLDQNCCPIYYHPTLVPNNFRGNDQNKKYLLPQLDISQKINDPIYNITLSNTLLPKDFPGQFNASPVDFVILKNLNYNNPNSPTLIAGNEATIVEQLLKSGSYPPYSGVEYYTNVNDCRDCYGALYKLGTPDPYGRQSTVEMSGTLLNANSGDQLVYTDILLQTSETLPISECIKAKYDGDPDPIAPYGILTNELSSSQSMVNSNANYYLRFDISYLYEITWDNTEDPEATWIPFTNKWRVSNVGYWAISGYSGNITRYDYHSIPDLISVTDSGLAFNPINTGVQIKSEWRNWYGSGVLIGNNDCDFEDQPLPLNKYGSQFRSEPTLTISSTGTGSGCSFIPTLQSKNEPNGLPYWNISEVTINGSGSGYTNNETLKINIAKGDVEEIPATLKLLTTLSQIVQPQISGTISANSLVPATLSVSTEIYQNDPNPKRWRVNSISVTDKGSGYDDGIYNIDFEPYNNSIEIASATGIAVTERIAPEFTATLVTASGAGANPSWGLSLERNSNGQKTWVFNGVFCTPEEEGGAPVFECGTGYTNDDYIELVFESGAIKDTFYDPYDPNNRVQEIEPRKYRIYLETFEGTVLNDNIPQAPAHYKSTGKIEIAIVTSSLLTGQSSYFAYPNDDPELFGGSYYKEIVGGIPTGVLIENSGKYYHSNSSTIRAISGPCITNIEADIWHPGPCGINSILETETSMNTPWENTSGSDGRINGTTFSSQSANFTTDLVNQYLLISNGLKYLKYKVIEYLTNKSLKIESILGGDALINQNQDRQYYVGGIGFNNLIYNLYKKSWILYNGLHPENDWGRTGEPERNPNVPAGFCPCSTYTNLGLIVTKYEGCEPFRLNNSDIPLSQWEIDMQSRPLSFFNSGCQVSIQNTLYFPYKVGATNYPNGTTCDNTSIRKVPVWYRACSTSYPSLYWGRQSCRNPAHVGNLPPDIIIDYSQGYNGYNDFPICINVGADRSNVPVNYYCDTDYILESGSIKCVENKYNPNTFMVWPVWQYCPDYTPGSPFIIG